MEKRSGKIAVHMHELYNDGSKKKPDSKGQSKKIEQSDIIEKTKIENQPEKERSIGLFVVELIFSVLLLAAICALRTVQTYANNVELVAFSDLGQSMWISMGASIAVFGILRIFMRKPYFACAFVALSTFFAVNFSWLVDFMRLFFKEYNPAVIGGALLYIVLVIGFLFSIKLLYKKRFPVHTIAKILSLTFTCLVLFNVVMASVAAGQTPPGDDSENVAPVAAYTPPVAVKPNAEPVSTPTDAVPKSFGLPNVYYFILDEYGTFDIMSKYYGYDNKVFYDFLAMEGFNISRESYGTDNQTANCFADLLNLDYISRKMSKSECLKAVRDAELFTIFSELGYSQFQVSNSKYFEGIESLNIGIKKEDSDYEEDVNVFGDQAADDITNDSIISALSELLGGNDSNTKVDTEALNQWGYYPSEYVRNSKAYKTYKKRAYRKRADALLTVFDYFENPSNYNKTTPRVIYSYMLATHVPFVFDEYGGIISYNNNRNWEDKNVYLNQYKYANKRLIVTLSTIIANDPESIIIIMSDHGIRYHDDCPKQHTFYITNKDSCRIMNAVYIKGQKHDIEGLSGVNTLRYILSLYEGLNYPPIVDPINSDSPDGLKGIIPNPR